MKLMETLSLIIFFAVTGVHLYASIKQDRNSGHLTLAVYKTGSKLKALINFPSIFEGKHVEKKDLAVLHTGRKIRVRFSRPCAAQIDGDTVLNVTEYEAEL